MSEKRTRKAITACGYFLSECLRFGWKRQDLDALEAEWWKYHDHHGCLITAHDRCKYEHVEA